MDSAKLNDWMQVVGIFAVVASLVFVGLQMRQDRDIAVAQIWAMSDQSVTEISQMVADNRDLWVRGIKGEKLSEVDQAAFQSIAWAVIRRHGNIANRIQLLSYGSSTERRVQRLAFDLYRYPGLRKSFDELRATARTRDSVFGRGETGGFEVEVEKALAELDSSSPPIPDQLFSPL